MKIACSVRNNLISLCILLYGCPGFHVWIAASNPKVVPQKEKEREKLVELLFQWTKTSSQATAVPQPQVKEPVVAQQPRAEERKNLLGKLLDTSLTQLGVAAFSLALIGWVSVYVIKDPQAFGQLKNEPIPINGIRIIGALGSLGGFVFRALGAFGDSMLRTLDDVGSQRGVDIKNILSVAVRSLVIIGSIGYSVYKIPSMVHAFNKWRETPEQKAKRIQAIADSVEKALKASKRAQEAFYSTQNAKKSAQYYVDYSKEISKRARLQEKAAKAGSLTGSKIKLAVDSINLSAALAEEAEEQAKEAAQSAKKEAQAAQNAEEETQAEDAAEGAEDVAQEAQEAAEAAHRALESIKRQFEIVLKEAQSLGVRL